MESEISQGEVEAAWIMSNETRYMCVCVCVFLQVEQVKLVDRFSNKSTTGTLYLTASHLIFMDSNTPSAQEIWVNSS